MGLLVALWGKLVRLGFFLLYNQLAFTYDVVSILVSLGDWRTWQQSSLTYLPEKESCLILEIAHGTGNLQLDLKMTKHIVLGCDLSPYMGRIAHNKLFRAGYQPNLSTADVVAMPFANQSYDVIISTFPTDFILRPQTLSELHRILVTDGCVIVVPNGTLTGGGVLRGLLEFAYRITGQRETSPLYLPGYFESHGFGFARHIAHHQHSDSEIWVLSKK